MIMKLFLSTDFEGTSGIVAWEQIIEGSAEYEQGRRLLTDEVNAVINGAAEGGATEFVVNDSHHYMRNLHPQDLRGHATLITGRHKPLYMMTLLANDTPNRMGIRQPPDIANKDARPSA